MSYFEKCLHKKHSNCKREQKITKYETFCAAFLALACLQFTSTDIFRFLNYFSLLLTCWWLTIATKIFYSAFTRNLHLNFGVALHLSTTTLGSRVQYWSLPLCSQSIRQLVFYSISLMTAFHASLSLEILRHLFTFSFLLFMLRFASSLKRSLGLWCLFQIYSWSCLIWKEKMLMSWLLI